MRTAWRIATGVAALAAAVDILGAHRFASAALRVESETLAPEMWGAGLLSTPLDELNTVFSPRGTRFLGNTSQSTEEHRRPVSDTASLFAAAWHWRMTFRSLFK